MRPVLIALALAAVAAPVPAGAATRHVSPSGAAQGSCGATAPCSVAWAVNGKGSAPGDTVVVGRGTYVDQPLIVRRALTITAAPDAPRPVFRTTAPDGVALRVAEGAAGTLIEHLTIRATGTGATAVAVDDAATLRDLVITSAAAPCLRSAAPGVRVEESTLTLTGTAAEPCLETTGDDTFWTGVTVVALNGEIAAAYSGNGRIDDATFDAQGAGIEIGGNPGVHRVTAAGGQRGVVLSGAVRLTDTVAVSRAGGSAVFAGSGAHQLLNVTAWGTGRGSFGIRAANGAQLTVKNSIARATYQDMIADAATLTVTGDCAAFSGCPAGRIVVDHSNFRTGAGTEDAGANQSRPPLFADPGFEDFRLREASPAVDAGSFEFNSGSADRDGRFRWLGDRPDMGAYEFPAPRAPRVRADRKAPTLGVVRLTATSFRAATGTTLIYVVSEDADLVLQVFRPRRGSLSVGTIVQPSARGTNRLTLRGRIEGQTLEPGRYVLSVIARDVSQNLSRPRRLPFTVVG